MREALRCEYDVNVRCNMLALVTNHMDENLHLGLRLVRAGNQVVWKNIETGAFLGPSYDSIEKAISGLRRLYEGAGSCITFMDGTGQQTTSERAA